MPSSTIKVVNKYNQINQAISLITMEQLWKGKFIGSSHFYLHHIVQRAIII